ncbi:MAG: tetratricopeptide repeat protein [Lentimonas sp.]
MPKANFKRPIFILLSLTMLGVIGCSGPEDKKESDLQQAATLQAEGNDDAALDILEALAAKHPNNPVILQRIGQIFSEQGDTTMAAFFLEQAHQQSPDDIELLYQTYKVLEAAQQPAGALLEKLSNQAPRSMTPELWLQLGQYYTNENKTQSALDAYLKGVDPENNTPSAGTAAAIGKLFIQLDNTAQAEYWLNIAADNDSPDAMTALFGLLEIKLGQKDREASEALISRLDIQFPGAVAASEWSTSRNELMSWREAQDAMQSELTKATAEEEAQKTATTDVTHETADTTEISEGKAQIIADLEAAEAMANTPAVEVKEATSKAIASNPEIAIEPAEPDFTVGVSYDQEGSDNPTSYTVENTVENTLGIEEVENTLADTISPSAGPRPVDELLEEANTATLDKNYRLAITNYWQALGTANDRDEIWNLLAQVYLIDGQFKNAETTALEAIRLSPRDINYTLDYLRVAQRSKTATEFFAELETAYDRFPQSPEVTLSLARGYERIAKNSTAASTLYQRFIDLAPNHPLKPEAEAAINRLQ